MSRKLGASGPFAPLIARLTDDLRTQAWAIMAEIIGLEIERRAAVLVTLDQAFDAVMAKARTSLTKSSESVLRAKAPRAMANAAASDGGEAHAIEPRVEDDSVVVVARSAAPARGSTAVNSASANERAQRGVAEVASRDEDEGSAAIDDPIPPPPEEAPRTTASERLARARARRAAAAAAARSEGEATVIGPRPEQATARAIGTVKRFDAVRGFGFIFAPDGGEDVFVHIKDFVGNASQTLVEGATVSYVPRRGQRGRFAVDVRPVGQ